MKQTSRKKRTCKRSVKKCYTRGLNKFFNVLKESYYPVQFNEIETKNSVLSSTIIPTNGNQYFTYEMETEVKKLQHNVVYTFTIKNREIHLHISDYNTTDFLYILDKIKHVLLFILQDVDSECVKTLYIYLYLMNLKKVIPADGVIKENNINSAVCYVNNEDCLDESLLYVFRKEEWLRAFIHECMHVFHFDQPYRRLRNNQGSYNEKINSLFNTKHKNIMLEETVAECNATILLILFNSFEPNLNNFKKKYKKAWKEQKEFIEFQCGKLLHLWDINYEDFFNYDEPIDLKTDTNVFAYIVLKNLVLNEVNNPLELFKKNDSSLIYYSTIMKRANTPRCIKFMNKCKEMYVKNKENKKYADWVDTLRLTL